MTFDKDYLEKLLKADHKHYFYKQACDIAEHLKFHFDGIKNSIYPYEKANKYFQILIEQRRPNESEPVQKYRKDQYKPITKIPCSKVATSLKKIPRSHGWKVDFSMVETPTILGSEKPEEYINKYFPVFDTVEAWYFEAIMSEQLKDPNGLILVIPYEYYKPQEELKQLPENEYLHPIAMFIPSIAVVDFVANEYAVISSNENWSYRDKDGKITQGSVYWFISKGVMHKLYLKQDKSYDFVENYAVLPEEYLAAWRVGGNLKEVYGVTPCYESFVSPMLPYLDMVATEANDLDAAVLLHLHPTMWYFTGQECNSCKGTGMVKIAGKNSTCGSCKGNGRMLHSPFTDVAVKPQEVGTQPIPTPPMGYVDKPVEIVKLQSERVKEHLKDALSAINMEFLYEEPLNISGTAKSIDRDELNNFVASVAKNAAKNIERTIELVIAERYPKLSEEEQEKLEPIISIPETFDFFTSSSLIADMKALIEADADQSIINAIEIDYVNKKFAGKPELRDKMLVAKAIDPFAGIPNADKTDLMLSGKIDELDYIVSVYINSFIEQAIRENKEFLRLERDKQIEIIYKYAALKKPKQIALKTIVDANGNGAE